MICRALCDLFGSPQLQGKIAFRGGTAIHKLLFASPLRYSEDIDLVQTRPEPIGETIDAIRQALNWLGRCKREQAGHSTHLLFQFEPEEDPGAKVKLKVEINTREHHCLYGLKEYPFAVDSRWYRSRANITSFEAEEIFGTKLRALLQRRKNRDLFDLYEGIKQLELDNDKVIDALDHYLSLEGNPVSRAEAEQRMLLKLNRSLTEDIASLLPAGITYGAEESLKAFETVWTQLISRMKGDSWKLSDRVIGELRERRYPNLLR